MIGTMMAILNNGAKAASNKIRRSQKTRYEVSRITQKASYIILICFCFVIAGCGSGTPQESASIFKINLSFQYTEKLNQYCATMPDMTGEWKSYSIVTHKEEYFWHSYANGYFCIDNIEMLRNTTIVFKDGKNRSIGKAKI